MIHVLRRQVSRYDAKGIVKNEKEIIDTLRFQQNREAILPSKILECNSVSREINFTTEEELSNLRLKQKVILHGHCVEEWAFSFGFVIPHSTNSWQQIIKAAGSGRMRNPQSLSGNVLIQTGFYDGNELIAKSEVKVYYKP